MISRTFTMAAGVKVTGVVEMGAPTTSTVGVTVAVANGISLIRNLQVQNLQTLVYARRKGTASTPNGVADGLKDV